MRSWDCSQLSTSTPTSIFTSKVLSASLLLPISHRPYQKEKRNIHITILNIHIKIAPHYPHLRLRDLDSRSGLFLLCHYIIAKEMRSQQIRERSFVGLVFIVLCITVIRKISGVGDSYMKINYRPNVKVLGLT